MSPRKKKRAVINQGSKGVCLCSRPLSYVKFWLLVYLATLFSGGAAYTHTFLLLCLAVVSAERDRAHIYEQKKEEALLRALYVTKLFSF